MKLNIRVRLARSIWPNDGSKVGIAEKKNMVALIGLEIYPDR